MALDFLLDTAANTNTINRQIAEELKLEIVGQALPGIGSSGAISGGNTYVLGDTQLEGVIPDDPSTSEDGRTFVFIQNLTASALPVASPASAGLMSLAFFYCFEGGVEFSWGLSSGKEDGPTTPNPPSIAFYAEKGAIADSVVRGLCKVKIYPVPVTQLPSIMLKINGVEIPALLDSGSPITVLNSEAAKQAGVETAVSLPRQKEESLNPFAAVSRRFKEAQAMSQAAADGNVLAIAGPNGPVNLFKSASPVEIVAVGEDDDNVSILREAAAEAGFETKFCYVDEVNFSELEGIFAPDGRGNFTRFDFWFKFGQETVLVTEIVALAQGKALLP